MSACPIPGLFYFVLLTTGENHHRCKEFEVPEGTCCCALWSVSLSGEVAHEFCWNEDCQYMPCEFSIWARTQTASRFPSS